MTDKSRLRHDRPSRQRGAAAIELALVFSLLFGLVWSIISFAFPLLLIQSMNRSVTEAARVAATVPIPAGTTASDISGYEAQVRAAAIQELQLQMEWLPDGWVDAIVINAGTNDNIHFTGSGACNASRPNCVVVVRLSYPNYSVDPVVPSINLPGLGQFPPLPESLEAISRIAL